MSDGGPSFRRLRWAVGFTWAASSVSAAIAVWRGDWFGLVPALNAAVAAAGWYVAALRWAEWRSLALQTLAAAGFLLDRRDDERPDSSE